MILTLMPSYFEDNCSLILLLATLFIICLLYRKKSNKIPPSPPGPRGLPLVGSLPFLDPELHVYFANLARSYGPIFKIHLGSKLGIVISSPLLAREVLKDHDIIFANRDVPIVGRALTYGGSDIVWNPYGPEWRMLRKVCVIKMLSNTTLDSVHMQMLRRSEVRQTMSYLYRHSGTTVRLGEQIFLTILNVITSMMWGATVKGEERASLGDEFRNKVSEMTELLGKPNISDFFPMLSRFDLQGLEKKMVVLAEVLDRIYETMINQRLKMDRKDADEDKGPQDFLHFLLRFREEEKALSLVHVKALFMDMIVGGTDTSTNSIEFAMAEIINNPRVMIKAQQELDEIVGRHNVVEECHIQKLQYLNAIMKETLRLHTPVPLLVPHCPSESCTIGGYTIAKGARVFFNAWAVHRDPSIWENPLEFIPERFLNDSKWDFTGNDLNYFPFGSGRRICAGIPMAERMFVYMLGTLLHSFEWKLPRGVKLDVTEKFGIVIKLKNPLVVIPTPRLFDASLYQVNSIKVNNDLDQRQ